MGELHANTTYSAGRLAALTARTRRLFHGCCASCFSAIPPRRVSAALVTFEPGARTAWHTHPLGQNLVVISGVGWTQCEGGPKKEIRPGDVVSCPCHHKHWHGATDQTAMSHIAIQEALDSTPAHWLDKVSDDIYLAPVEAD